ncbi:MAG: 1-deoxy-D-xylulose-5-phosphate synthase, partial [Desulfobacterium sp.]|nr:1-deoxy-D-xylulose-5-phosphate synthase [Desulfobacterium sp.]
EALPVIFAIDRAGIVGEDGATHNGLFDLSYLRNLPNMVVMAPKDENELRHMLLTALSHDGPIAFRYPRGTGVGVPLDPDIKPLPIGKGEILKKGKDILILAIGQSVCESLNAYEKLISENGISATVVNCRFVKPIDAELITSLIREIPRVITVEENVLQGGFGSAVLECLSDKGIYDFKIERLGIQDVFVDHGPQNLLRAKYKIDSNAIVNSAIKLMGHIQQKS